MCKIFIIDNNSFRFINLNHLSKNKIEPNEPK